MIGLFLLDVASDPPSAAIGIGLLIILAIVILALISVLIFGFVLLLVWRKQRKSSDALIATTKVLQSNSPNQ
jgi:preprotein translocase subunit YajC